MKRIRRNPWDIKRHPRKKKRPTPFRLNCDTDNDGVVDWKDCRPFNPKLQHSGPSELPISNDEELLETTMHILSDVFKIYGGKNQTIDVANAIVKAKLDEKHYSPKGHWDIKSRGFPVFSFKTSIHIHPTGNLIEVYDEFHDVYFYANVTGYFHSYSAITLDDKYVKGTRGKKPKLVLVITGFDKEQLGGRGLSEIISFMSLQGGITKRKKTKVR